MFLSVYMINHSSLQSHPEFSGLQGLCHFLQYIPQPSEILDFFNPVAKQIIQLMKGKACLPAKMDSSESAMHAFTQALSESAGLCMYVRYIF